MPRGITIAPPLPQDLMAAAIAGVSSELDDPLAVGVQIARGTTSTGDGDAQMAPSNNRNRKSIVQC